MVKQHRPPDPEAYARSVAAVIRAAYPGGDDEFRMPAAADPKKRRRGFLLLPVLATAAIVCLWFASSAETPLAFTLEGAQLTEDRRISPTETAVLRFSDGSHMRFAGGSDSTLQDVTAHGASLRVRSGRTNISVAPRAGAMWTFSAGPYRIDVLGTRFSLEWQPEQERLDLRMAKGRVRVTGPLLPEGVSLSAGQRLAVSLRQADLRISTTEEAPPHAPPPATPVATPQAVAAPAEAPTPVEAVPSGEAGRMQRKPATLPPSNEVGRIVARGDYRHALARAKQRGLKEFVATASASELAALAEAARYERDMDVARQALAAQRTRFATTRAGAEAAFHLGRLAEDIDNDPTAAARWFALYLHDQPQGRFASEGLGRQMVALSRSGDRMGARKLAQTYLSAHADGAYAHVARRLVGAQDK